MPYLLPRNPFHALLLGLFIVFVTLALIGVEGEPGWLSRKAGTAETEAKPEPKATPTPTPTPSATPAEAAEIETVSDEELVVDPVGEEPVGLSPDPGEGEAGEGPTPPA